MTNSYILVTGSAGFIGASLAAELLLRGHNVLGVDNINDYYSVDLKYHRLSLVQSTYDRLLGKNPNLKYEFIRLDISHVNFANELSSYHIETIVHLAAQAGVRYSLLQPGTYIRANIVGFQNIIDFVKARNITKFLYASSSSVYGKSRDLPLKESSSLNNPESLYAATKLSNEMVAASYYNCFKLKSIGMRFFTVYGPLGRPDMAPMLFADAALKGEEINVFNRGEQTRDFTYITDIINGIYGLINALENDLVEKNLVVNIGKGRSNSLMQFITLLEKHIGRELRKNYVHAQIGDVEHTEADISRLREIVQYDPKMSLDKGLSIFCNWYIEYNRGLKSTN